MNVGSSLRRFSHGFGLWRRWASHRRSAVVSVGVLAFLGCFVLSLRVGERRALIHDEFANLLGADTLAHGRLTNPTPPLAQYFESPHVLVRPVYASKYPPGQALFMALGLRLTGHPIVGVWLSVALACAALCWMLQAWLPNRWALAGGLLAASRLAFLAEHGRWSQTYWAGAVAVLGASLVYGATGRLRERPRRGDAFTLALGLFVLAISRPLEGALVSLPPLAFLCITAKPGTVRLTAAPLLTTLGVGAVLLGIYSHALTGHFWRLPHSEYQSQYGIAPMFLWQPLSPSPHYSNAQLADFNQGWEVNIYRKLHGWSGYLEEMLFRARDIPTIFLGLPLLLPLIALPKALGATTVRLAAASCLLLACALATTTYYHGHYGAPAMPLLVLLSMEGLRRIRTWSVAGLQFGRVVPALLGAIVLFQVVGMWRTAHRTSGWADQRAAVERRVAALPGKHLILVRYGTGHSSHQEWVYNGADLDGAKVLWVHELEPAPDHVLLAQYPDRTAWVIEPERGPMSLRPYPPREGPVMPGRRPVRGR